MMSEMTLICRIPVHSMYVHSMDNSIVHTICTCMSVYQYSLIMSGKGHIAKQMMHIMTTFQTHQTAIKTKYGLYIYSKIRPG